MHATIDFVINCFKTYNSLIFRNSLPLPPVSISNGRTRMAYIKYRRDKTVDNKYHYHSFSLHVSSYYDLSQTVLEDIVIHEMIHYKILYEQLTDTSPHGRLFKNWMNHINQTYDRHISISFRCPDMAQDKTVYKCIVGIIEFRDGRKGITHCAKSKLIDIYKYFEGEPSIAVQRWLLYTCQVPLKFPRVVTPKVYKCSTKEIERIISMSSLLVYMGGAFRVSG